MNKFLWTLIIIMTIFTYAQAGGTPLNDHTGTDNNKVNGHWSAPGVINNKKNPSTNNSGSINRGRDIFSL